MLFFLVIVNREIIGDFKKEDLLKYRIFISKNIGLFWFFFKLIICFEFYWYIIIKEI